MIKLTRIKKIITETGLKACNISESKELTLCFNILEIPNEDVSILTLSVLLKGERKNALIPMDFAKLLSNLERILQKVSEMSPVKDDLLFSSLNNKISSSWYKQLDCHRIFLIPTDSCWLVLERLSELLTVNINLISVNIKAKGVSYYMSIHGGKEYESCKA